MANLLDTIYVFLAKLWGGQLAWYSTSTTCWMVRWPAFLIFSKCYLFNCKMASWLETHQVLFAQIWDGQLAWYSPSATHSTVRWPACLILSKCNSLKCEIASLLDTLQVLLAQLWDGQLADTSCNLNKILWTIWLLYCVELYIHNSFKCFWLLLRHYDSVCTTKR